MQVESTLFAFLARLLGFEDKFKNLEDMQIGEQEEIWSEIKEHVCLDWKMFGKHLGIDQASLKEKENIEIKECLEMLTQIWLSNGKVIRRPVYIICRYFYNVISFDINVLIFNVYTMSVLILSS